MDKQTVRFILLSVVIFLGFSLFSKYFNPKDNQTQSVNNLVKSKDYNVADEFGTQELPNAIFEPATKDPLSNYKKLNNTSLVNVVTDNLSLKINENGDLIFAELKKYPKENQHKEVGFPLLTQQEDRFYIVQSGLLSEIGPDSKVYGRAKFTAAKSNYVMQDNQDQLTVDLSYAGKIQNNSQLQFIKRFIFYKNSYLIDVQYIISNNGQTDYTGSMYGRLRRSAEKSSGGIFGGGLRTYTGAAINTPEEKYKKLSFANMKDPYRISFNGGWIAMLEHYFVSAWIPDPSNFTEYQTEQFNDNTFGIRFVNSPIKVSSGTSKVISTKLFIGPKITKVLKEVSPALDLTVDYGVLWWLCVPLFWLLKNIFNLIGNWGWSIIITTLIVKLLFYRLSAYSFHSMGNLRKLQPKIEALKANIGDDRQKFSQAIMELYRKEKVNPLGGCLPILLQIPVFISLYYVLLESVELRQASWWLWITDLSAKDPFYVLPVMMGLSMFFQQKMNPPPADPMQAKILMIMPIFFSVLFLQFPSGLMLYWVVNNTLSILQQMFINKNLEKSISK